MCADRVHRIFVAIILGLVMGVAGASMFKIAFLLQLFVMIMLLIWAFTNFCPSLYILTDGHLSLRGGTTKQSKTVDCFTAFVMTKPKMIC